MAINLSKPANQIWCLGFLLCLITTCFYFFILGYETFPSIHTPYNTITIIIDYWFFSIPIVLVGITFFIRYYKKIHKKYKSSQKEYLAIISTMLLLAIFPTIIISAAILEITSSYLAFLPAAIIIACLIIINILKHFKQTSF